MPKTRSGQEARTQRSSSEEWDFNSVKQRGAALGIKVSDEAAQAVGANDALKGIEWVMKEFPELRGAVDALGMDADYDASAYCGVNFTGDYRQLGQVKSYINMCGHYYDGDYSSGSSLYGGRYNHDAIAAHEAAHALANIGTNRLMRERGGDRWDWASSHGKAEFEHQIIDPVIRRLKKETGIGARELRRSVSDYATTNYHETIAECMADYYLHGESANPLSVGVFRRLKQYFS